MSLYVTISVKQKNMNLQNAIQDEPKLMNIP